MPIKQCSLVTPLLDAPLFVITGGLEGAKGREEGKEDTSVRPIDTENPPLPLKPLPYKR